MKTRHNQRAVSYRPIGVIRTLYHAPDGTLIQPRFTEGIEGTAEVLEQYTKGLKDVAGSERLWLLYHFGRIKETRAVGRFRSVLRAFGTLES